MEHGGSAALAVSSAHEDVTYTTLGARQYGQLYQNKHLNLHDRLVLGWRHAYDHLTPVTSLAFASNNLPFVISGTPIAHDALLIDAGVDLTHATANWHLRLGYLGQWGSHVTDHAVTAVFAWQLA